MTKASRLRHRPTALAATLVMVFVLTTSAFGREPFWTDLELRDIKRMSLEKLRPLMPDPSDRVADDPQAAALGRALFFDARFSANGTISCATCHAPEHQFQDDLPRGRGIGLAGRRTMPLAGTAYHPFFFWDGRKDSQWSQALGPLENPVEHGSDRAMIAQVIAANYRADFEAVFGSFPKLEDLPRHAAPSGSPEAVAAWAKLDPERQKAINVVFSDMGKAIEAFERTIPVPETRFDSYAAALNSEDKSLADKIFTVAERNGLKLFLGQGDCVRCHSGPQFTDLRFHNLGIPDTSADADAGRRTAVYALKGDPFNCLGEFSDARGPGDCLGVKLLRFDMPDQLGAFKSPSLRGVAQRPPYMHTGQFATMDAVLVHYNLAPKAVFGESELTHPLKLTEVQMSEIEAFLHTLDVGNASDQIAP